MNTGQEQARRTAESWQAAGSATFELTWKVTGHWCTDCGLPAAFRAYRYNGGELRDAGPSDALCAICTANAAADDQCLIERIEGIMT